MKKVNVQRDLESQMRMAEYSTAPVINPEPQSGSHYAESEVSAGPAVNETVTEPEKATKKGRAPKGDTKEV